MRTAIHDNCVQLNLSANDTYDWAVVGVAMLIKMVKGR
jgi:hypothetical protein